MPKSAGTGLVKALFQSTQVVSRKVENIFRLKKLALWTIEWRRLRRHHVQHQAQQVCAQQLASMSIPTHCENGWLSEVCVIPVKCDRVPNEICGVLVEVILLVQLSHCHAVQVIALVGLWVTVAVILHIPGARNNDLLAHNPQHGVHSIIT